MNNASNQFRQGDVFVHASTLPNSGLTKKALDGKRLVLAYGEVTGHAHAILEVEDVEAYEKDGITYLRVKSPVTLCHEEHSAQVIPPGDYEVTIQREYHPESIRSVQD